MIVFAIGGWLLAAALFVFARRALKMTNALVDEQRKLLKDEEGLIEQQRGLIAESEEVVKAHQKIALDAGHRADVQERRAGEFFGIIEGIEGERDQWKALYYEQARQSGVAQTWLIRDLSAAVQRGNVYAAELRKRGVKVKDLDVDPALREVLSEYGAQFPEPRGSAVTPAAGFERAKLVDEALRTENVSPGQKTS